jgi:hypothetical protein
MPQADIAFCMAEGAAISPRQWGAAQAARFVCGVGIGVQSASGYDGVVQLRRASAGGRRECGMLDNTTTVVLLILIVAIYMLPTLIANARDHPRRRQITVVNILFGWTLVGWLVAFFWAAMGPVPVDEMR